MRRKLTLPSLLLLLALAACGTPQEQCIRRNTAELRAVTSLLAETEANLARGYAWDEQVITRPEFSPCRRVVRDKDGNPRVITTGCWRDVTDTRRIRRAIDPVAEARKAESLRARQAVLARQAEAAIRVCKETYPEKG